MPQIARLLIYTGTEAALEACMGRSLNDGRKDVRDLSIRVVTLPQGVLPLLATSLPATPERDLIAVVSNAEEREEIKDVVIGKGMPYAVISFLANLHPLACVVWGETQQEADARAERIAEALNIDGKGAV